MIYFSTIANTLWNKSTIHLLRQITMAIPAIALGSHFFLEEAAKGVRALHAVESRSTLSWQKKLAGIHHGKQSKHLGRKQSDFPGNLPSSRNLWFRVRHENTTLISSFEKSYRNQKFV